MNFFRNKKKLPSQKDNDFYNDLAKILGFKPKNINIYKKAFTHSSVKEVTKDGKPLNYERLEFLGDTVLSTVISDYLFKASPLGDEGYLTQMRSKIVSRNNLNDIGKDLNLIHLIKSQVRENRFGDNIHGNVFEALIGAIYVDKGFNFCKKFIHTNLIKNYVEIADLETKISSYKSLLIEWCQKEKKEYKFEIYEDSGNDIKRHFSVKLYIEDKQISKGRDTSKKKAEEKAAKRGYYALKNQIK